MLVQKIESAGLALDANWDKLIVTGDSSDEQITFLKEHKEQILREIKSTGNPTVGSMRKTQPPGWGWWGYQLADGGIGSIRGPFPTRSSAQGALQREFHNQVTWIAPLDGSKSLVEILKTDERPGTHAERQQEAVWQ